MKLVEVKLTNFRGYENETNVSLDLMTILIGKNDAGKSSILDALDIYFNESTIEKEDCCMRTASDEVRIACVFEDLPETIVIDELHETTLQSEYLVRADGKLEVVKIYDCSGAKGKVSNVFARASHPSANQVDDLLSLKITELRTKAQQLGVNLEGINQTAKAQIRKEIWRCTQNLQLTERDVSLKKETAKDAYDQIQKYMPIYALFKSDRASTDQDAEAQDPLKIAIKEAIKRREADLIGVIADIKRELESVAARTVDKIREMSPDLANELHPSIKNKQWDSLFNVTLTGEDDVPVNKRGSGVRRLILLNFFRAKAEEEDLSRETGVIYAVEEPETSQHPNYQVMLLDAFQQLVEQGRCQVLLTTHTPTLARRVDKSYLRLITRQGGVPVIEHGSIEATLHKITQTLGVLPDHDVKVFFGVEGKHDISFLKQMSVMLSAIEPDIPNLENEETNGRLVFVPLGGSSLELWVTRLKGFDRPEFYLTDRDSVPPALPKYHQQIDAWNARGCTAWVTSKRELENYLDVNILTAAIQGYGGTGDGFEDVPLLFAEAVHGNAPGAPPWPGVSDKNKKEKESRAKKHLNTTIVAQMTPDLLTQADPGNEIRQWLREIGVALNR